MRYLENFVTTLLTAIFISSFAFSAAASSMQNIDKTILSNGLDIILVENHTVPLITIAIASKNGSAMETPDTNGLSHLYEHMFFKANKNIPNQQAFDAKSLDLGLTSNAFTDTESVVYYFTLPSYNLEEGLKLMNDAIRTPLFDQVELDKEIKVVLEEYNMNDSTPISKFYEEIDKRMFKDYYKVNVLGDRKAIAAATREKMINIQNKFYIPNNCALIVAGDVDKNNTLKTIKTIFGDWEKGPDPFAGQKINRQTPITKTEQIIVNKDVKSAIISINWSGVSFLTDENEVYAAELCCTLLSLPTSKIYKNLVEKDITVESSFYSNSWKISPKISFDSDVEPSKVIQAQNAMLGEITKMANPDYITQGEIDRAKKTLEADHYFEQEKAIDFGIDLGDLWCIKGLDYNKTYIDNIKRVTKKDILNFLKKYIIGKPFIIGILVSKEDARKYNIN